MKPWELKILNDRLKGNSYTVSSNGVRFLCEKIRGVFYVKNKDRTPIYNATDIVKL